MSYENGLWHGRFQAMAGPCELLLDGGNERLAKRLSAKVAQEAWRIERKFSRYRDDNLMARINTAQGGWTPIDSETYRLLEFAQQAWKLSGGKFDISSGILRRVWRFDGSDRLPSEAAVAALLPLIGWQKIEWDRKRLRMPAGMELDFGGIGKEYAVDRAFDRVYQANSAPLLVNFGGDLICSGPRSDGQAWQVGIEAASAQHAIKPLQLFQGALATSGDAQRYLQANGVRYSHVLDAQTGWPVAQAPASVTAASEHCSQAGLISSLAMLQGAQAETFLQQSGADYWIQRSTNATPQAASVC